MMLTVFALNFIYSGRGALADVRFHTGRPSAAQLEFHVRLRRDCDYLLRRPGGDKVHEPVDFGSLFASMRTGYDGEAVARPLPLTVAEVEPGLPPLGSAASIDALDLCDEH
eukprot:2735465-Heterocapsa_arctica.AAC.1